MTLSVEKWASTNQLTLRHTRFLQLLCLRLFCFFYNLCIEISDFLTVQQIFFCVILLYIIGEHAVLMNSTLSNTTTPLQATVYIFTSALHLQEHFKLLKYACVKLACFTLNQYFIFILFLFSQKNMPFWRVSCRADLEALSHALELDYL